jgi:predicted nucleic-acid-binding Zn-ribbon protein
MLKTSDNGHCPRCGAELELKDEVIVGNEGWSRQNVPYPKDEWDDLRENYVHDCSNCTYRYP